MRILFLLLLAFIGLVSADADYKENLSDYGFFKGTLKEQIPSDGVVLYTLNSPLFSDYASKLRFVKLPAGIDRAGLDRIVNDLIKRCSPVIVNKLRVEEHLWTQESLVSNVNLDSGT